MRGERVTVGTPGIAVSVLSDLFDLDVPALEKVLRSALVFAFLVVATR